MQDLISNAFEGECGVVWCWNPVTCILVKGIIIREIMETERFFDSRKDHSELFDPTEEIARQIEHGERLEPMPYMEWVVSMQDLFALCSNLLASAQEVEW
jgi:hypothetical protein